MKALAAVLLLFLLSAGTATARVHRRASLRPLTLAPPTFRGSGFGAHERVTISLRGLRVPAAHVVTNARGRFRVRLASVPVSKAWTVRAVGARGERVVYHHSPWATLETDVEGTVKRGPITPICSVRSSCSAAVPGVTVQAFVSRRLVAETTTDENGSFTFSLATGDYTIRALGRGTKPQAVHVTTSTLVHLAFLIDTRIR